MDKPCFLLVNKPAGITSFKVISELRKITHIRKIGHAGTLDPFATGLLPICIGKATRLASYLSGSFKTYIAEMKLGVKTDTGDLTGTTIEERIVPELSDSLIEDAKNKILNIKTQTPPPYSAVKKNGKRAYELARKGLKVELEPRPVVIESFKIIKKNLPYLTYEAKVSKGTYIRVLSETFAEYMGTIATTTALIRTEVNNLNIADTVHLRDLDEQNWENFIYSPEQILTIPQLTISKYEKTKFCHGQVFEVNNDPLENCLILTKELGSIGVGSIDKNKILHPKLVFFQ